LPTSVAIEGHLAGAVGELLAAPGSLVRAQLAYGAGRALGLRVAAARSAAVAVEYLHTASLVFDDLPAMDDARERRGRPCPHVLFGEGAAILAGLALVHRAHALVAAAAAGLPAGRERRIWQRLEECVGLAGILDGQARDLHFPRGGDPLAVAAKKTTPLLRLALLLPAAAAGAAPDLEESLDRLAAAWGLAYQILDDFRDVGEPWSATGKSARRDATLGRPNFVLAAGGDRALAVLERELEAAHARIARVATLAPAGDLAALLARMNGLLGSEADRLAGRCAAGD
jgi:geranylgeranyl pyrophosphate synthase